LALRFLCVYEEIFASFFETQKENETRRKNEAEETKARMAKAITSTEKLGP
jgi:cation transport regulator ChaB